MSHLIVDGCVGDAMKGDSSWLFLDGIVNDNCFYLHPCIIFKIKNVLTCKQRDESLSIECNPIVSSDCCRWTTFHETFHEMVGNEARELVSPVS